MNSNSMKDTNPKDVVGSTKTPMSVVPTQVIHEVALGMLEGAMKYGRHNYRHAGVRASIYYDATKRHLDQWWEGEDIDPDSELSHITKAIASLCVLRDAMLNDMMEDDRPPSVKNQGWLRDYNEKAKKIIARYADVKPKHYTIKDGPQFDYSNVRAGVIPSTPFDRRIGSTGLSQPTNEKPLDPSQCFPFILRRKSDYPDVSVESDKE